MSCIVPRLVDSQPLRCNPGLVGHEFDSAYRPIACDSKAHVACPIPPRVWDRLCSIPFGPTENFFLLLWGEGSHWQKMTITLNYSESFDGCLQYATLDRASNECSVITPNSEKSFGSFYRDIVILRDTIHEENASFFMHFERFPSVDVPRQDPEGVQPG